MKTSGITTLPVRQPQRGSQGRPQRRPAQGLHQPGPGPQRRSQDAEDRKEPERPEAE